MAESPQCETGVELTDSNVDTFGSWFTEELLKLPREVRDDLFGGFITGVSDWSEGDRPPRMGVLPDLELEWRGHMGKPFWAEDMGFWLGTAFAAVSNA